MPLPTLSKTWRFLVNQAIPAGANAEETNRNVKGAIYWALIGKAVDGSGGASSWTDSAGAGASAPVLWTAESTCDGSGGGGSFGNNDQVDRILDTGDCVLGNPGSTNNSWYVIKNAGMGDLSLLGMFGNPVGVHFYTRPWAISINGFGTTNGGADGTANLRPTATDENPIAFTNAAAPLTTNADYIWLGNPASATTHKIHVMAASDGSAWRIIVMRSGFVAFYMHIEVPQSPIVIPGAPNHTWNGVDKPYVAITESAFGDNSASRALQRATWKGAFPRLKSHMAHFVDNTLQTEIGLGIAAEAMFCSTSFNPLRVAERITSELDNTRPLIPLGVWGENAGYQGRAGVLTDIWCGNDSTIGVAVGDTYPNDTSRQFASFDFFTFPWNSTVVQTS